MSKGRGGAGAAPGFCADIAEVPLGFDGVAGAVPFVRGAVPGAPGATGPPGGKGSITRVQLSPPQRIPRTHPCTRKTSGLVRLIFEE
jgi:hypothetical protein